MQQAVAQIRTRLLKPLSNIPHSLLKDPKIYMWDWALVKDKGACIKNFVASHLHKAVDHWNDCGLGSFGLYFLRDKRQREVDFVITKDDDPWILIEVKKSQNHGLSKSLLHFSEVTKAEHVFQLIYDIDCEDIDLFKEKKPTIAPLSTFLSQLP